MPPTDLPISLRANDASVALFVRGLTNLKTLLKKGEAHASAKETTPANLLEARLASDMVDLAAQAHWSIEGAKLTVARLLGQEPAPAENTVERFSDLYERIDDAIAYLSAVDEQALEAGLGRAIVIEYPRGSMTFSGIQFLMEFAVPTFFFHVTTAYAILRQAGIDITKGDFLGVSSGPPRNP